MRDEHIGIFSCIQMGLSDASGVRASKSRPDGEWSDDDYDVFDGDQQYLVDVHAEASSTLTSQQYQLTSPVFPRLRNKMPYVSQPAANEFFDSVLPILQLKKASENALRFHRVIKAISSKAP